MAKRYFIEGQEGSWKGSFETLEEAFKFDVHSNVFDWFVIRDVEDGSQVALWTYESESFDGGFVKTFGWVDNEKEFHPVRQERYIVQSPEEQAASRESFYKALGIDELGPGQYLTGSIPDFKYRKEDL